MNKPIESLLELHLASLSAPDELWDRVQYAQAPAQRLPARLGSKPLFPALAAALLLALAILPFVTRYGSHPPTLRSSNAGEIRAWARSRTGLDIPLPGRTSNMVLLTGACAVRGPTPSVEVDYRVAGHSATLLISRSGATPGGDRNHRFLKCQSNGGTRVSSWTMRGQLYTLAYAGRPDVSQAGREECLLCHLDAPPLSVSN